MKKENAELKEKIVGYDHLLRAEGGVTIEKVIDIKKEWMGHKKEIRLLKKENEELKDLCWETQEQLNEESQQRLKNKECWMSVKDKYWKLKNENDKLKKENAELEEANMELGEESEEIEKENVKLKNNNQIVGFMLMDDYVRKEIEETIDEGINQYTFKIGTGFYREHILTYVKDIIIPHLTTYRDGDSQYSSYQNGLFYYNMDCMNPYEIETNDDGTYTFNRVESDEEDSDSD